MHLKKSDLKSITRISFLRDSATNFLAYQKSVTPSKSLKNDKYLELQDPLCFELMT